MSVEKDIRYELLSRLCPNTTGERTDLHPPTPPTLTSRIYSSLPHLIPTSYSYLPLPPPTFPPHRTPTNPLLRPDQPTPHSYQRHPTRTHTFTSSPSPYSYTPHFPPSKFPCPHLLHSPTLWQLQPLFALTKILAVSLIQGVHWGARLQEPRSGACARRRECSRSGRAVRWRARRISWRQWTRWSNSTPSSAPRPATWPTTDARRPTLHAPSWTGEHWHPPQDDWPTTVQQKCYGTHTLYTDRVLQVWKDAFILLRDLGSAYEATGCFFAEK